MEMSGTEESIFTEPSLISQAAIQAIDPTGKKDT
jgi:dynein heavy chain